MKTKNFIHEEEEHQVRKEDLEEWKKGTIGYFLFIIYYLLHIV
jgi:hypothetical protein